MSQLLFPDLDGTYRRPPSERIYSPLLGKISPITFSMTRLLQNATFDAPPSFFAISQSTYYVLAVRPSVCLENAR
jgi:hypothetical protein